MLGYINACHNGNVLYLDPKCCLQEYDIKTYRLVPLKADFFGSIKICLAYQ